MATFTSQSRHKQPKTTKKRITRWRDWWLLPLMVIISALPALNYFVTAGRVPVWAWILFAVGVVMSAAGLWLRLTCWPKEPLYEQDGKIFRGRQKSYDPDSRPNSKLTWFGYCWMVRGWRQIKQEDPTATGEAIALELNVSHSTLSKALQAWRTGQLDDRYWWFRLYDDATGRSMDDDTRYIPPEK